MKYVYLDISKIEGKWAEKAAAALKQAFEIADPGERRKFINGKAAIWSELKPVLDSANNGKCWYSEAREKVSYFEVDHYRPKKIYPWLAFEWKNFRLCGGKPNRKKLDKFPLENEASRASTWAVSCNAERPLLLDPTVLSDPDLLTFSDQGEPVCSKPDDSSAVSRVNSTVPTYGLDSEILCDERRAKWRKCTEKLTKLQAIVEDKRHQENSDAADFSSDLCKDIAELFDDASEFTATAMAAKATIQNGDVLLQLARHKFRLEAKKAA
ncbi:hypothetical protein [Mesorhizobium sp. M0633]|uniref:hypothetical protein n=1 Tax=Mesorhizobium sp. M0633 TaxID=2956977 RepID=UPI00333B9A87